VEKGRQETRGGNKVREEERSIGMDRAGPQYFS